MTRTGFGDPSDPTTMSWFTILTDSGDSIPDWIITPIIATRIIPGSNPPRSVSHYIGVGPASTTWHIYLDTPEEYDAFRSKLATEATLWVLDGLQTLPGLYLSINGEGYVELPGTTMYEIMDVQRFVDGITECRVTFQRQVDPATGGLST